MNDCITADGSAARSVGLARAVVLKAIKLSPSEFSSANDIDNSICKSLKIHTIRKNLRELLSLGLIESREKATNQINKTLEYKLTIKGDNL